MLYACEDPKKSQFQKCRVWQSVTGATLKLVKHGKSGDGRVEEGESVAGSTQKKPGRGYFRERG